ncbi:MAG: sigma-70 family RNA polymerase sigma factor [Pelolinea sp.]|nr:sigma-70 family RNA polymerase sigma factor [Pelolinea sp.]
MNSGNQQEAQIIEKAISGDKQAFGRLYEQYFQQISEYLLIRSNNKEDAEDMTEVVFMKAWKHLPGFGKKREWNNFRAWLYRIAHNTLVDHYRTRKQTSSLSSDLENSPIKNEPGLLVLENEEKKKMFQAIRNLDEISQNVIACRFFGGLSHKETALSIGINENNVRVIQYRALKKIQELLREDDE